MGGSGGERSHAPLHLLRKSANENLEDFQSKSPALTKQKENGTTVLFLFGGSEGIRTPEPVKTTRFPIVPVVTTSIRFHFLFDFSRFKRARYTR